MIIPVTSLDSDTLRRITEEFVTREGTDYGYEELTLDQKVDALLLKIRSGDVLVSFDEAMESVSLVSAQSLKDKGLGHY